jgi:hypothetical protein
MAAFAKQRRHTAGEVQISDPAIFERQLNRNLYPKMDNVSAIQV